MESWLDEAQVKKAVVALQKYTVEVEAKSKPQLIKDDPYIYLVGNFKKLPPRRPKPHRIPLPHPLNDPSTTEVCIFTKEAKPLVKKFFSEKDIKFVNKIISISKLKSHYKSFERRKQLAKMYDVYLSDSTIFFHLYKHLGNSFMGRRGIPPPVSLTKKALSKEIQAAITCTHYQPSKGTAFSLRIGKLSMTSENLVDNTVACMRGVASRVPKGWRNLKALHLKTSESVALPIYNSISTEVEKLPEL